MTLANYTISITADSNINNCSVDYNVSDSHLVTQDEINAFSLTNNNLTNGVGGVVGQNPDNVWLADPTNGTANTSLYSTYSWQAVTTNLTGSGTITNTPGNSPITLETTPLSFNCASATNTSSSNAEVTLQSTTSVETTISSSYSETNTISVSQSINYGIALFGGSTTLSYSYSWGNTTTQQTATTIGSNTAVTVDLDPGQSAYVQILYTQGTMTITIPFNAQLGGLVASNWSTAYNGHHYRGVPIGSVLSNQNLPPSLNMTETVTVVFYTGVSINVMDASNNAVIKTIPIK